MLSYRTKYKKICSFLKNNALIWIIEHAFQNLCQSLHFLSHPFPTCRKPTGKLTKISIHQYENVRSVDWYLDSTEIWTRSTMLFENLIKTFNYLNRLKRQHYFFSFDPNWIPETLEPYKPCKICLEMVYFFHNRYERTR